MTCVLTAKFSSFLGFWIGFLGSSGSPGSGLFDFGLSGFWLRVTGYSGYWLLDSRTLASGFWVIVSICKCK